MPTDTRFTFTNSDAAECDAIIREYHDDLLKALSQWLQKDEELHPERYADGDPDELASGAAWDFFTTRTEANGIDFNFAAMHE
jgi:hypothetical protein